MAKKKIVEKSVEVIKTQPIKNTLIAEKQKEIRKKIAEVRKQLSETLKNRKNKPAKEEKIDVIVEEPEVKVAEKATDGKPASESVKSLIKERNNLRAQYIGKIFPPEVIKRMQEIEQSLKA